ncbi:hypothetical protein D3C75_908010 [compost metagenome]
MYRIAQIRRILAIDRLLKFNSQFYDFLLYLSLLLHKSLSLLLNYFIIQMLKPPEAADITSEKSIVIAEFDIFRLLDTFPTIIGIKLLPQIFMIWRIHQMAVIFHDAYG